MFKISISVVFCLSLLSCKVSKPYTQEMKDDLKEMYQKDQNLQNELIIAIRNKKGDKIIDSINLLKEQCFIANQIKIKSYFKSYGYPYITMNDKKSAFAFWIITQHSDDDVYFQKKVLRSMKRGLSKKDVNLQDYAYLYDRVMKNTNRHQSYGTQMIIDSSGKQVPYKIRDIQTLDDRRKSVGLSTMQEYLLLFKKANN